MHSPSLTTPAQPQPDTPEAPPLSQQPRPSNPFAHTLSHTHRITFPTSAHIFTIDFSPDGKTAYCHVDGTAIDLWSLGLSRWPEALGGTLALLALIYLLILARIRRRPQRKGEPYCSRCNYHLQSHVPSDTSAHHTPAPSPRCPECGLETSKKKPTSGKSVSRRLLLPTTLLVLLAAAYASLFLAGVSRNPKDPNAPAFWSTWVNNYALRTQYPWLLKHQVLTTNLMAVNTQSGTITGCLRTMRGWVGLGVRVSPDGRFIAITESPTRLSWIRADSGKRVSSAPVDAFFPGVVDENLILAVQREGEDCWVYYKSVDARTARSRLAAWNPSSGRQRILVDEPAFVQRGRPSIRRYALIHRDDGLATISAPDFSQTYDEKTFTITVRGPSSPNGDPGPVERSINVPSGEQCSLTPLLATTDGSMLFVQDYAGILGYNANTGESLGRLAPPSHGRSGYSFNAPKAILHQGRLFLDTHPNSILVRDLSSRSWLARLKVPQPFIGSNLFASPDGRWLAAVPFRTSGMATKPYIHELFLYDLTPLNSPPPTPAP